MSEEKKLKPTSTSNFTTTQQNTYKYPQHEQIHICIENDFQQLFFAYSPFHSHQLVRLSKEKQSIKKTKFVQNIKKNSNSGWGGGGGFVLEHWYDLYSIQYYLSFQTLKFRHAGATEIVGNAKERNIRQHRFSNRMAREHRHSPLANVFEQQPCSPQTTQQKGCSGNNNKKMFNHHIILLFISLLSSKSKAIHVIDYSGRNIWAKNLHQTTTNKNAYFKIQCMCK